ncbi:MAG: M6 family metalloprotease domain-containing protein [Helicobacteraceae bacterium]|nr:M6 family metalloprotease domain-containing protein [Helicobacteraceae bacterium]
MFKILLFLLPFLFLGCDSRTIASNVAPIANAGLSQYLEAGSIVYLDGSASSDANGDTLTYSWTLTTKPSGSTALLQNANTAYPYFTTDFEGDYIISLVVNDGEFNSKPDYVTISTVIFVDPSTGSQAHNEIFTPTSTTITSLPMLVILLEFQDQSFVSLQSTWQQKLFGTNTGELNDYYQEISHGQFEFVPVADAGNVTNGITTIHFNENHPDPDIDSYTFEAELHPFLKQAIEAVSAGGFDFNAYDFDGNNAITPDELIITFIMAGEEDAYLGNTPKNGVWAHQWCTENTYTPLVNGVSVMSCNDNGNYAIFGERHNDATFDNVFYPAHNATVGIIAHELGHSSFSLPDLYDTNSYYGGIGYYGLMANGAWGQVGSSGQPGDTPTHMTAWSKIDIGWYSAIAASSDINADVAVNATGTDSYNIIKAPVSGSTDEYFLVENRGINGYDAGLKYVNNTFTGGLAIWHIDAKTIRDNLDSNSVNDNTSHKGVDLEEANTPNLETGTGDPTKNLYYSSNKTEFTPNTVPNTNLYDNSRSFIFFTDVSGITDMMTVRINNPL